MTVATAGSQVVISNYYGRLISLAVKLLRPGLGINSLTRARPEFLLELKH